MSRPQRVSTEEIIAVARTHFITKGHSASIKSIAQDVGLTHSAILQRFGSKRDLMIKALEPPVDYPWPVGFLDGPMGGVAQAIEQLKTTCEMLMMFLHQHMPQIVVLQSAGVQPDELFQGRLPLPLLACKRLQEWIDRGRARGIFETSESAAIASTIVGTMFVRSRLESLCTVSSCKSNRRDHQSSTKASKLLYQESLLGTIDEVMNLFATLLINNTKTDLNRLSSMSVSCEITSPEQKVSSK